jgi:cell division protein ZapA (FtsZ GTPase activity inhibitor)
MKKGNRFVLIMTLAVITAMVFTACGSKKQQTLESYVNDHPEIKAEIDEQIGADEYNGITVEFSGNDMIYNFDLSSNESITEEMAKSEEIKTALDEGLAGQEESFKAAANTVLKSIKEDGGTIDAIRVIVNYNYGDELITSATFDSDPAE